MRGLAQLLAARCRPLEGHAAMTPAEIASQLAVLPDWRQHDGALEAEYRFGNYYETLAWVNALAFVVHAEDHHPDLLVSYNRVRVRFNTHAVGGISENDFICAAKADQLFAARPAAARG